MTVRFTETYLGYFGAPVPEQPKGTDRQVLSSTRRGPGQRTRSSHIIPRVIVGLFGERKREWSSREHLARARLVAISPIDDGPLPPMGPSARFASLRHDSLACRAPASGGVTGRTLDDNNASWWTTFNHVARLIWSFFRSISLRSSISRYVFEKCELFLNQILMYQ